MEQPPSLQKRRFPGHEGPRSPGVSPMTTSAQRSLSSPLPAALLAGTEGAHSVPLRGPRAGSRAELHHAERNNAPLRPQLPSFCALPGIVYLNHAAASRSAQSQRAQIPAANGSRPRGFLNRPSPPIAARRS